MTPMDLRRVIGGVKPLLGVFAHCLEHHQADVRGEAAGARQQLLVDQSLERANGCAGDLLSGLDLGPAREDGEARECFGFPCAERPKLQSIVARSVR